MDVILRTKRLLLREMGEEDFPALCRILRDEKCMYAYAHAFDLEESRQWLERQQARYRQDGFGLWAVVLRQTGEMIGQCGLTWQEIPGQRVLEVGYLFQRAFWHQGFAAESAKACRAYAFETLGAQEVFSIIRENNVPSRRVAQGGGMTVAGRFTKHYYGQEMPHLVYRIGRREWEAWNTPPV